MWKSGIVFVVFLVVNGALRALCVVLFVAMVVIFSRNEEILRTGRALPSFSDRMELKIGRMIS